MGLENYYMQYRNDFCLAKGEGLVSPTGGEVPPQQALNVPNVPKYKYLSPSAQRVFEEAHDTRLSS